MGVKKDKDKDVNTDKDKETKEEGDIRKAELPPINFFKLFGYATGFDQILIVIGVIFAIAIGAGMPALMIFMGEMTDTFVAFELWKGLIEHKPNTTGLNFTEPYDYYDFYKYAANITDDKLEEFYVRIKMDNNTFINDLYCNLYKVGGDCFIVKFKSECDDWSLYMVYVGIAFIVCSYIFVATLAAAANNQAHRIRIMFFESVMKQDIAWYDTKTSGDFATKVSADLSKIQDGIGDKVTLCIFSFSTVLFSLGTAFYYGWELTLIILCVMPVLVIAFSIIGKIQARVSITETAAYSKAGAVAEEVLGSIRTVYAFDGQNKEINRYEKYLEPARKSGTTRTLVTGLGLGIMWFCIYCSYALAFWYGVGLISKSIDNKDTKYTASTLLIVFFSVLMGTFSMGQASPYFEAFNQARGAASLIFEVIERKPIIDSSSESGVKLKELKGEVEFRNVHFNYPAREEVRVLEGLHLIAEPGETVALVGPSGCGKSTVIQLVQRFYDVAEGQVLIDGKDIREYNIGWLRDNIGVVGQEPVLFGCSITENIKLGYQAASQQEVESASTDANAIDFINQLPNRFNTLVGERGSQLSGGQKQRVAIARALVRNPKILLLDEATSALDLQSESIVQAALDRARIGRTTFIVAHRLSTIKSADKIIVIDAGKVKEVGTHDSLMDAKGLYYTLVKTQQQSEDDSKDESGTNGIGNNVVEMKLLRALSFESGGDAGRESIDKGVVKKKTEESPPLIRLVKLLKEDKVFVATGCISAFVMGLSIPAFAILFGDILGALGNASVQEMKDDVALYAILFCAMGVVSGLAGFLQIYMFGYSGERLTMRLRKRAFTSMLSQEIGWYDESGNSTGSLCTRLSADTASVQGAAGSRLSTLCQAVSTLSSAIVIALIFSWKLGLVILCFVPIVIICTYFQMQIISGQISKDMDANEDATRIAVEAISNIRTVASLHKEKAFYVQYVAALQTQYRKSKIRAHLKGFTFGVAQSMGTISYAVALFYGSRLIANGELNFGNLFKSVEAVIFGTAMVGQAVAFAPDYQKGKIAAVHIFKLLDRIPRISVNPVTGDKPHKCDGNVSFNRIEFTYPTRPKAKILRGLSFDVKKGQTVALVGSSGCGKSTCIQLLERFYDCDGEVTMDGKNIVNLNIPWLRKQLGIVSQEPVLFGLSIQDNIAYGDNHRQVPTEDIVRAAQKANIHDFIKSLPMAYDTLVGDKGTQLSGGQKQRIAIARALVRNPEILLLDEATSALDSESEKIVQAALDEAREGRTCIVIAHRLSTIQNADKIVVINRGKVVEEGTHQDLIQRKGEYFQLYNVQTTTN